MQSRRWSIAKLTSFQAKDKKIWWTAPADFSTSKEEQFIDVISDSTNRLQFRRLCEDFLVKQRSLVKKKVWEPLTQCHIKSKSFTKIKPAIFVIGECLRKNQYLRPIMICIFIWSWWLMIAGTRQNNLKWECVPGDLWADGCSGIPEDLQEQSQQKPIKYKGDCRTIKDHHSQSGSIGNGSIKWTASAGTDRQATGGRLGLTRLQHCWKP